jgi:hypothetical protein
MCLPYTRDLEPLTTRVDALMATGTLREPSCRKNGHQRVVSSGDERVLSKAVVSTRRHVEMLSTAIDMQRADLLRVAGDRVGRNHLRRCRQRKAVRDFHERGQAAVRTSPAIGTGGSLFVANNKGTLFKLDAKKGATLCTVGSNDERVYALDGANAGQVIWSFKTGGNIRSSPAIGLHGTVYVGSNDDKLYAFGSMPSSSLLSTTVHGDASLTTGE